MSPLPEGGARHQSWNEFSLLLESGHPAYVTVPGSPPCKLFIDDRGRRIGLLTPWDGEVPASPLKEVAMRTLLMDGRTQLEVSTTNPVLHREFHALVCSVADRIQLEGKPANVAVHESIRAWIALLRELSMMPSERQLGLLGELWLLDYLGTRRGYSAALNAWRGPNHEEHDFEISGIDIEVKTTAAERRVHSISSITQLIPSLGRELFVLSVQFTRSSADEGFSLATRIKTIRALLPVESLAIFDERLATCGWHVEDAEHYTSYWRLRTPPTLVPVDEDFPVVALDDLRRIKPRSVDRILDVTYRVDLTGLGWQFETKEFISTLD